MTTILTMTNTAATDPAPDDIFGNTGVSYNAAQLITFACHAVTNTVFVAPSTLSNYTMQADVMTDGNARSKSDIGVINQRYLICLRSNAGKLEVSSNPERMIQTVPFKVSANTWYTLKTRVDVNADGSGVVKGKIWVKGQPEPEAWTIEAKVPRAHTQGSPGIYGLTAMNQKRVFLDNLSITENK